MKNISVWASRNGFSAEAGVIEPARRLCVIVLYVHELEYEKILHTIKLS
ncbi:MAG TPA: hypothetical protein PLY32_04095 [Salinivirgaceae bacterium]|nr:hypothetical protein [Salinivirgaceae bacterium]